MRPELVEMLGVISDAEHPVPIAEQMMPGLAWRLDEFLRWRLEHPLKTMEHS